MPLASAAIFADHRLSAADWAKVRASVARDPCAPLMPQHCAGLGSLPSHVTHLGMQRCEQSLPGP